MPVNNIHGRDREMTAHPGKDRRRSTAGRWAGLRRTAAMGAAALTAAAAVVLAAGSPASAALNNYTFAGLADWDHDGHIDIVARDAVGDLYIYPGDSQRAFSSQPPTPIGTAWNGYTFAGIADGNQDGNQDIVTTDPAGALWLYPGQSTRAPSALHPSPIGDGWNCYTFTGVTDHGCTFVGVTDWDGDGYPDIIARDTDGNLWGYWGDSTGSYDSSRQGLIGNGWNGYTFAGIADVNRDNRPDIVAMGADGVLWLYSGQNIRGPGGLSGAPISDGWNGYTFAGVTDWDTDGYQDVIARETTGDLWAYWGDSTGTYNIFQRTRVGSCW